MKTADFDYDLPPELVAQYPAEMRSESRMMVLDRAQQSISDRKFSDLPDLIDSSYFIVINDSRVFKARLFGKRATGGKVEVFLVRRAEGTRWLALLRPSGRTKAGERIIFDQGHYIEILDEPGREEREIKFNSLQEEQKIIEKFGQVPLPPYIRRDPVGSDSERYQTIYAANEGSVAAPTAGLHFDDAIFDRLIKKGIDIEKLTLHVGPGTFKPVKHDKIEKHIVDPELASLDGVTAQAINRRRDEGKKLLAVGTTSVRTLESFAGDNDSVASGSRMVELYIYPPYRFRVVEAVLTNFHLPKSSLLMLVAAFCGHEFIMRAYHHAVEQKYRFYSYGDCMLIL